jgi:hypothetical protein
MSYETFELRFEGCNHTMKIPLLHNADDSRCFICHPDLRFNATFQLQTELACTFF